MKRCEVRLRVLVPGKKWGIFRAIGAVKIGEIYRDSEGLYSFRLNGWRKPSRQFKTQKRAAEVALSRV